MLENPCTLAAPLPTLGNAGAKPVQGLCNAGAMPVMLVHDLFGAVIVRAGAVGTHTQNNWRSTTVVMALASPCKATEPTTALPPFSSSAATLAKVLDARGRGGPRQVAVGH